MREKQILVEAFLNLYIFNFFINLLNPLRCPCIKWWISCLVSSTSTYNHSDKLVAIICIKPNRAITLWRPISSSVVFRKMNCICTIERVIRAAGVTAVSIVLQSAFPLRKVNFILKLYKDARVEMTLVCHTRNVLTVHFEVLPEFKSRVHHRSNSEAYGSDA